MNLAAALDFLLWQGHGPRAWDYTLRQINLFVETANERMRQLTPDANRLPG